MSLAFSLEQPVRSDKDLESAATAMKVARERWESLGFQRVTKDELRLLGERVNDLRDILRAREQRYEQRVNSTAVRLRLRLLRSTLSIQNFFGIDDGHVWSLSFLSGFLTLLCLAPIILMLQPPALIGGAIFLLVFLTVTLGALIFLVPLCFGGPQGAIESLLAEQSLLREQVTVLEAQLSFARTSYDHLHACRRAQIACEEAADHYERLKQLLADERYQLLTMDWRSLRDVPFEDFLARVFCLLGYRVERTKVTGDQGVDLIVSGKGRRIAVQSKGYEGSVGNEAVQQAFAGKVHYKCEECVAITNSRFTSGAVQLALSVDCNLIDGACIPDLICGKLY